MELLPAWISIPFHFIWISFAVLFGFRIWTKTLTWSLALVVVLITGLPLVHAWAKGMRPDELSEIPLMFCMFLAMVWHTNRRKAAFVALHWLSEKNAQMLQREQIFVQNASHELRTPITVALAHAELAQLSVDAPPDPEDLGIVVDELGRLRKLTNRLLLLAAVDAPEFITLQPTDLAALAEATMRRWRPIPRRWQMNRRNEVTVLADPERLLLALDTVVENAVNVTHDGDTIEVSIACNDGSALIEVSDNGPGFAPSLLESAFDRFTRDPTERSSHTGSGLGLAVVKAIIEAHGGSVVARNRPTGGAVVALRLPLSNGRAPTRQPEALVRSAPRDRTTANNIVAADSLP